MFKNKGQSIIEYAALAMLVIVATMVMGPYVLRSVGAHFKLWQEQVDDSYNDRLTQEPTSLTTSCIKSSYFYDGCGGNFDTSPIFCDGYTPPVTGGVAATSCSIKERHVHREGVPNISCYHCEACIPDATCCDLYKSNSPIECGTVPWNRVPPAPSPTVSVVSPRDTGVQTADGNFPALDLNTGDAITRSCYYGEELLHNSCWPYATSPGIPVGFEPIECKVNSACNPTCIGSPPNGAEFCPDADQLLTKDQPSLFYYATLGRDVIKTLVPGPAAASSWENDNRGHLQALFCGCNKPNLPDDPGKVTPTTFSSFVYPHVNTPVDLIAQLKNVANSPTFTTANSVLAGAPPCPASSTTPIIDASGNVSDIPCLGYDLPSNTTNDTNGTKRLIKNNAAPTPVGLRFYSNAALKLDIYQLLKAKKLANEQVTTKDFITIVPVLTAEDLVTQLKDPLNSASGTPWLDASGYVANDPPFKIYPNTAAGNTSGGNMLIPATAPDPLKIYNNYKIKIYHRLRVAKSASLPVTAKTFYDIAFSPTLLSNNDLFQRLLYDIPYANNATTLKIQLPYLKLQDLPNLTLATVTDKLYNLKDATFLLMTNPGVPATSSTASTNVLYPYRNFKGTLALSRTAIYNALLNAETSPGRPANKYCWMTDHTFGTPYLATGSYRSYATLPQLDCSLDTDITLAPWANKNGYNGVDYLANNQYIGALYSTDTTRKVLKQDTTPTNTQSTWKLKPTPPSSLNPKLIGIGAEWIRSPSPNNIKWNYNKYIYNDIDAWINGTPINTKADCPNYTLNPTAQKCLLYCKTPDYKMQNGTCIDCRDRLLAAVTQILDADAGTSRSYTSPWFSKQVYFKVYVYTDDLIFKVKFNNLSEQRCGQISEGMLYKGPPPPPNPPGNYPAPGTYVGGECGGRDGGDNSDTFRIFQKANQVSLYVQEGGNKSSGVLFGYSVFASEDCS